jgi:hypothetical protein
VRSTTFLFTTLCTSIQLFEKNAVKGALTGRNAAQPRSRAPPARRAFCRSGCAACCVPATTSPRRSCRTVPLSRTASHRLPSAPTALEREVQLPRRTASYGELRIARRSVVRSPARRGCLGRRRTGQLRRARPSRRGQGERSAI